MTQAQEETLGFLLTIGKKVFSDVGYLLLTK